MKQTLYDIVWHTVGNMIWGKIHQPTSNCVTPYIGPAERRVVSDGVGLDTQWSVRWTCLGNINSSVKDILVQI